MNNQQDQLSHSLLIGLSDEQVMLKVKDAIKTERQQKQQQHYEPFISWQQFLKTKMANKIYRT